MLQKGTKNMCAHQNVKHVMLQKNPLLHLQVLEALQKNPLQVTHLHYKQVAA